MTSTTETETKVETAPAPAKEVVAAEANDNVDAVKDEKADANSTPASPKKTETLKPAVTVHKKDFENDVVYLYQFVRSATIPSLSSCCLKIETFLRMNQIQYENVDHKLRYKSKKGQLPFIELNGKELEDSDFVIRELSRHFNKDLDSDLTPEQRTISHALESMLNNHTGWVVRWWRYNNPQEFLDAAQLDIKRSFNSRFPNSILNFVFKLGFKKQLRDSLGYAFTRFTPEEVYESAKEDFKALSNYLGDKEFFFGKQPHLLDIAAFAHLAQFVYVPFGGLKEFLESDASNLISFVERMKGKYYADWDEICSTLELNTHLPKKEGTESQEAANEEAAKKQAEKEAKKKAAEEKKKEREAKKLKEKEEREKKKKEKEAKAKAAAEEKAAAAAAAAAAATPAPAAETETKEASKDAPAEAAAPNGGEAPKTETTANE